MKLSSADQKTQASESRANFRPHKDDRRKRQTRFHESLEKIKRFFEAQAWLIREGLSRKGFLFFAIVTGATVSAFAQGATIAYLAFFVNVVQGKRSTGVDWIDHSLQANGLWGFAVLCLVFFLLLFVSAVTDYFAVYANRKLARSYHRRCAMRVLEWIERLKVIDPANFPFDKYTLKLMATRNSLMMGKNLELIALVFQPLIRFCVVMAILVSIDVKLTAILVPFSLIVLPFLYRLSEGVQSNAKFFYGETSFAMSAEILNGLQYLASANVGFANQKKDIRQWYAGNKAITRYYDCFDNVLLANERSELVVSIFRAFFLIVLLMILGYRAIHQVHSWGFLVAYIAAMQQLTNHIKHFAALLSTGMRFYPLVRQYIGFCEHTQKLIDQGLPAKGDAACRLSPEIESVEIKSRQLFPGGRDTLALVKGRPLYFYHDEFDLNRICFYEYLRPLIKGSKVPRNFWLNAGFVSALSLLPTIPLKDVLMPYGAGTTQETVWNSLVAELDLDKEISALLQGAHEFMDSELWHALSHELRALIQIFPLVISCHNVAFIDWEILRHCRPAEVSTLLKKFEDRFLLLVISQSLPAADTEEILIAKEQKVAGAGTVQWFKTVHASLQKDGVRHAGKGKHKTAAEEAAETEILLD
ncbi:MAG: hypothetical protein PHN49_04020 [Candidatus Omnitrophica bacterium]|nr:hypothetical protein [Candidatus Omnitrophota bacterium]MDD5670787.1 hypothetical protein [Candidatus Omnitrophota bacterium]